MSDPSIAIAEAFKQFSQVTVSAVGGSGFPSILRCSLTFGLLVCSQLRAYEHGTRARLTQAEDDLRVLRRERDDSIRDLNACKEQSRAWLVDVNRCKAEARFRSALFCPSIILTPQRFTTCRQIMH